MTIAMKWEFFPIFFYTTKFKYKDNDNSWAKKILIPRIEKDLRQSNNINSNWDCNVSTNFHKDKNFLDEYKSIYQEIIEEFLYELNINQDKISNWNIENIWYNSYNKNVYQERHNHFPDHFSMIHYLEFDSKEHYGTKFFNPNLNSLTFTQQQLFLRMNQSSQEFDDIEEGDIIFFPSFVDHLVKPNNSRKRRTTVALNLKLLS